MTALVQLAGRDDRRGGPTGRLAALPDPLAAANAVDTWFVHVDRRLDPDEPRRPDQPTVRQRLAAVGVTWVPDAGDRAESRAIRSEELDAMLAKRRRQA